MTTPTLAELCASVSATALMRHVTEFARWTKHAGTPEELIPHLRSIEDRFPGLETVSLSMPMGTPESIMLEQYRIVGEAVMPAFKGHG